MKKIYLFIAIAFVFVSCQSNAPQNMKVINLSVNSADWIEKTDNAGLNRYYSAHFTMPEITSFVYSSGSVEGYFVDNGVRKAYLMFVIFRMLLMLYGLVQWISIIRSEVLMYMLQIPILWLILLLP